MKALLLIATLVSNVPFLANATPKNHEISGFHFANCSELKCIEVWADKGYLSQLQFSFATEGKTKIKVTDLETKASQEFNGTNASMNPRLDLITLDTAPGAVLITMSNAKAEVLK